MAYESERGNPSTDQCAAQDGFVTLLFDGYYLKLLIDGQVDAAWHARSGVPKDDWFNYTPEQQRKGDEGPIPAGEYWIRPDQISVPGIAPDSWGNFRIIITICRRPRRLEEVVFSYTVGKHLAAKVVSI